MICVCMQPSFLPWLGFFDLFDQADVFVLLNDLQFEHQSWQHRNRIVVGGELQWLAVPVQDADRKRTKMLKTIEQAYSGARFSGPALRMLGQLFDMHFRPGISLTSIQLSIFFWIANELGLATSNSKPVFSSGMYLSGKRSARLIDICRKTGCDTYLTTPGSCGYLREEEQLWRESGVEVLVHNYEHPEYEQVGRHPFVPYASVLDLLVNCGAESADIIRSGRRESKRLFS